MDQGKGPRSTAPPEEDVTGVVGKALAEQGYYDLSSSISMAGYVSFSPDGRYVAAGPAVWDTRTGEKVRVFDVQGTWLVCLSPDGRYLAAGWRENSVALLDVRTGVAVKTLEGHTKPVYGLSWSQNAKRLATGSHDGRAVLWDVETGAQVRTFEDGRLVEYVALSPDDRMLATSARPRGMFLDETADAPSPAVVVWDTETGARLRELGRPGEQVRQILFSPDGRYLATSGGVTTLWSTETWEPVHRFPPGAVAYSPDGRRVVAATRLWDVQTGGKLLSLDVPNGCGVFSPVAFSPDRTLLAMAGRTVRLWSVKQVRAERRSPADPESAQATVPPVEDPDLARILKRFRENRRFHFGIWNSVVHMSHGRPGADTVLTVLGALQKLDTGDRSLLDGLGGSEGIKEKLVESLGSEDPIVRAGAAMLIGMVGDKKLAPNVAELLDRKSGAVPDDVVDRVKEGSDRRAAAMALGMLAATEYAPRLAGLLHSDDEKARAGAMAGLALMGAKEQAGAIAGFLQSRERETRAAAIGALAQMGAKDFAPEIAKLLDGRFLDFESRRLVAFALAKLGAREQAGKIAMLLDGEFSQGAAAKALALLNATEYAPRIAKLLRDESSLVRKDALISLGLMRADQYADRVAAALEDNEGFVVSAAAVSLLLMDADAHADRIISIIDDWDGGQILLAPDDVPLPDAYSQALRRAKASLEGMRRKRSSKEE